LPSVGFAAAGGGEVAGLGVKWPSEARFQRAIAVVREGEEEGKEAGEDPYPKANLRRRLAVVEER
jgi:hypothetical protein